MSKRILYLEDLYDFYSQSTESVHYSANDEDVNAECGPIVVQTRGKAVFEKADDEDGLTRVKIRAAHTGLNLNQSSIDIDVMNKALPSLKNRPILGYIHDVDGKPQFEGHEMHVGDDGNVVYDERPIGIVPESNNAKIVYDEETGKSYVETDGYIFDEYSEAKQIFEREGECPCSVELSIRDLSYNAKDKVLIINDFFFSGITVLGYRDNGERVNPGMEGANIKLADFTQRAYKADFSEQVIEMQGKLDALLSHFNIGQSSAQVSCKEGGNEMSDFENKDALIEEPIVEDSKFEDDSVEESVAEDVASPEGDSTVEPIEEQGTQEEVVEEPVAEDAPVEAIENMSRTYELSHDDIRCALYELLAVREEESGEYFFIVDVYDDYFVYESCCGGGYVGQKYIKDDDNIAFDGEPYVLHAQYLTDSEQEILDAMRANYESLVEFKNATEQATLHAEREAVMADVKYSIIAECKDGKYTNAAYADLYENMDKYSCDELDEKLKVIVGEYALNGGKFEAIEASEKRSTPMFFRNVNKNDKKNKYGTLKFN